MPELPEVETVRRSLEGRVLNEKISKVWIEPSFEKKVIPNDKKFIAFLKSKKFKSISRRGKLLIFEVDADNFVLVHLRMTGQLIFRAINGDVEGGGHPTDQMYEFPNKHTRVIFYFSNGARLFFNDMRKFGYLNLVNKKELEVVKAKFGLEPIEKEYSFENFESTLNKRPNQKIKVLLLDQNAIAGLGNIYVDEACHIAGVRPQRLIKSLTKKEREKLHKATTKILQKAIKHKGTTFRNYLDAEGESGNFQKLLKVYGRCGLKCKKCLNGEITKIKIAGRTSSYCPKCQK